VDPILEAVRCNSDQRQPHRQLDAEPPVLECAC
jgi:hypothetical protein